MVQTREWEVLQAYVDEVTGLSLHRVHCEIAPLPMHIRHTFEFVCVCLGKADAVLAFARPGANVTPTSAEKQVPVIGEAYGRLVVLVLPDLPAWARRGFIERKLSFITPNRQMFLPHLGFDYRDRVLNRAVHGSGLALNTVVFTPSEQQILLFMLLSKGVEFHADDVLNSLSVSPMTVSRAFRAFENRGLIDRPQRGRKRPAVLRHAKRAVWDAAQPFLQNPVKESVVLMARDLPFPEAGLTALAQITNIAAPEYRTVAASADSWRIWWSAHEDWRLPGKTVPEAGDTLVQVWTYNPESLASEGQVDSLSLYLTLRESQDERIDIARTEMLEVMKWHQ